MRDTCPRCMAEVRPGSVACGGCGYRMTSSTARRPVSADVPAARPTPPGANAAPAVQHQHRVQRKATSQSMAQSARVVHAGANQAASQAAAQHRVHGHVQSQLQPVSPGAAQMPGIMGNSMELETFADTGASVPLDDPLRGSPAGPVIDTISLPPPKSAGQAHVAPPESQQQVRARSIKSLAEYGEQPKNIFQTVPYFVRVMLRRRELQQELSQLATQRKRIDGQADDALCALGEVLYALRNDPRTKPLLQQFRVVAEAHEQVGVKEAAGQQASAQHKQELARLTREIAKADFEVSPLRKREAELQAREDSLKSQVKKREGLVRKAEAELEKIRASKDFTAPDKIAMLEAERDAHSGEIQSFNVQLLPLQEDLGALRREIAKHMGTISALREEESAVNRAMDREQERHRMTTGGARSAHREALRALAGYAQRSKLATLCPAENDAAIDAADRARKKHEVEELQRAATQSYDAESYKRGMYLLVGGTAAFFVIFVALIAVR